MNEYLKTINILGVKQTLKYKLTVFCDMASCSLAEICEVSVGFGAFIFMVGGGSSEFLRIFMNACHRMPEDSRFCMAKSVRIPKLA